MFKVINILNKSREATMIDLYNILSPLTELLPRDTGIEAVDTPVTTLLTEMQPLMNKYRDMSEFATSDSFYNTTKELLSVTESIKEYYPDIHVKLKEITNTIGSKKFSLARRMYTDIETEVHSEMSKLQDGDFFVYADIKSDVLIKVIHILVHSKNHNIYPISQSDFDNQALSSPELKSLRTTLGAYRSLLTENHDKVFKELLDYINFMGTDCKYSVKASKYLNALQDVKVVSSPNYHALYDVVMADDLNRHIGNTIQVYSYTSLDEDEFHYHKRLDALETLNRNHSNSDSFYILKDLAIGYKELAYIMYPSNPVSKLTFKLMYKINIGIQELPIELDANIGSILPNFKDRRFPLTCMSAIGSLYRQTHFSVWDYYLFNTANRNITILLDKESVLQENMFNDLGVTSDDFSVELLESTVYGKRLYDTLKNSVGGVRQ